MNIFCPYCGLAKENIIDELEGILWDFAEAYEAFGGSEDVTNPHRDIGRLRADFNKANARGEAYIERLRGNGKWKVSYKKVKTK